MGGKNPIKKTSAQSKRQTVSSTVFFLMLLMEEEIRRKKTHHTGVQTAIHSLNTTALPHVCFAFKGTKARRRARPQAETFRIVLPNGSHLSGLSSSTFGNSLSLPLSVSFPLYSLFFSHWYFNLSFSFSLSPSLFFSLLFLFQQLKSPTMQEHTRKGKQSRLLPDATN